MRDDSNTTSLSRTGPVDNQDLTDPDHLTTGVAADLYAPVPGDDNDTRPGMVGQSAPPLTRTGHDDPGSSRQTRNTGNVSEEQWNQTTPPQARSLATLPSHPRPSEGGIMQTIHGNPLAVVAAATAGGMLVGRMRRNRGHRNNAGYLRASSGAGDQRYQEPQPSRQPSFFPYQANPGYRSNQGYQGYQTPGAYQGAPQYRADQPFRPEQGFHGRHEHVPSASTVDAPRGGTTMHARNDTTIVDNEVYNVIKAAAVKLEGLAAYTTYEQDGQANDPIWQQLRQQDEHAARQLLRQIESFARDGKLTGQ